MPNYLLAVICIAFLCSCQSTDKIKTPSDTLVRTAPPTPKAVVVNRLSASELAGTYTGQFDDSAINITIDTVNGNKISGYNIHKGLKRPIEGHVEPFGSQYKVILDEPGDNKYDGHFELFIDTSSFTGRGAWEPKNDTLLKKTLFNLKKDKKDLADLR